MASRLNTDRKHVELLLLIGTREWERLPAVEAEIDRWDHTAQEDYLAEWPLQEQRLDMLAEYEAAGVLTADQSRRLEHLRSVATRNRPIVRRLLDPAADRPARRTRSRVPAQTTA